MMEVSKSGCVKGVEAGQAEEKGKGLPRRIVKLLKLEETRGRTCLEDQSGVAPALALHWLTMGL